MISKQETFNTVVAHLRRQGCRALSPVGACQYRTRDGKKCAVGCLIPDDIYIPEMEGKPLYLSYIEPNHADNRPTVVCEIVRNLGHDVDLARDLQYVHDFVAESWQWEQKFKEIAQHHGLEYTEPVIEN